MNKSQKIDSVKNNRIYDIFGKLNTEKKYKLKIKRIDLNESDATATIGKSIRISTDFYDRTDNEIYYVLSHEIGHKISGHCNIFSWNNFSTIWFFLAALCFILNKFLSDFLLLWIFISLLLIAIISLCLEISYNNRNYSRIEDEADRNGFLHCTKVTKDKSLYLKGLICLYRYRLDSSSKEQQNDIRKNLCRKIKLIRSLMKKGN